MIPAEEMVKNLDSCAGILYSNNRAQRLACRPVKEILFQGPCLQDMNENYNILCICGPTASGKTSLAVKAAIEYGGEIISADSRQVFRGMDIGTGKDLDEYTTPSGKVKYHLIDIVHPGEEYNLYRYLEDFRLAYSDIHGRGLLPVLAGGSGLYIEAALKGYSLPDAPADNDLRAELEHLTRDELAGILENESPGIFKITDLSSTRRIIRGIEVARYLEKNPAANRTDHPVIKPLIICITPNREELVRRIDTRLERRISQGLVAEVKALLESGITHERMIRLGLEYRYAAMHLAGEMTLDEMQEKLKIEIHRFAKRQMTWFRGMERRGFTLHRIPGPDFKAAKKIIDSSGLN